jgi:nitroreductase
MQQAVQHRPVAVLTIGFAAEAPARKPRKSVEEIVYYNRWGSAS